MREVIPPAELALRDEQEGLWTAWMDAQHAGDMQLRVLLIGQYEENILAVLADVRRTTYHANSVDPERFSIYSDCYKDHYGFRPRQFMTHEQCVAGLKYLGEMEFGD